MFAHFSLHADVAESHNGLLSLCRSTVHVGTIVEKQQWVVICKERGRYGSRKATPRRFGLAREFVQLHEKAVCGGVLSSIGNEDPPDLPSIAKTSHNARVPQ